MSQASHTREPVSEPVSHTRWGEMSGHRCPRLVVSQCPTPVGEEMSGHSGGREEGAEWELKQPPPSTHSWGVQ